MAMMTDGVIHCEVFMAMMMVKVTIMVTTAELSTIVIAINQAIAKYIAIANAMVVTIDL